MTKRAVKVPTNEPIIEADISLKIMPTDLVVKIFI